MRGVRPGHKPASAPIRGAIGDYNDRTSGLNEWAQQQT